MADLRVGYDLFAGSSQAGTDDSTPGNIQIETNENKAYKLRVQRLVDDEYYNATTDAWVASAPAEADELDVPGSSTARGIQSAVRRLLMKLPKSTLAGIDSTGCVLTAYGAGNVVANDGVSITLAFLPVTA